MDDYWWDMPQYMFGSASPTAPADVGPDPVEELRQCVEEVTGLKLERPVKPRIGFLPWEKQ